MRLLRLILPLVLLPAPALHAQTPATATPQPITPAAYESWNSIRDAKLSNDGRWVLYTLAPYIGEGEIVVRSTPDTTEYRASRGYISRPVYEAVAGAARMDSRFTAEAPVFTADSRWVIFTIEPPRNAFEEARREKAKPEDQPKASLGIMDLETGQVTTVPRVRSFRVPRQGDPYLAYRIEPDPDETDDAEPEAGEAEAEEPEAGQEPADSAKDEKETGSTLVLRELASGAEVRVADVVAYIFTEDGSTLGYTVSTKDGETDGAFLWPLTGSFQDAEPTALATGAGRYRGLTFDRAGQQVAFLTDKDDYQKDEEGGDEEQARYALYYADISDGLTAARAIVPSDGAGEDLVVASNGSVEFTRQGKALRFGVGPKPVELLPADSLADRAVFDLWHYRDPFLQPTQERNAEELRRPWYTAVYWPDNGGWVQLGDEAAPEVELSDDLSVGLAVSVAPYLIQGMWGDLKYDIYVVDPRTGERRLVKRGLEPVGGPVPRPGRNNAPSGLQLSPGGKYVIFYENRHWFSYDRASGRTVDLTGGMDVPFYNELADFPAIPRAYGVAGWMPDDERVLLYDRFDIWELDPTGAEPPINLTDGVGRASRITFRILDLLPAERRAERGPYLDPDEPLLLSALDYETKATGLYRDRIGSASEPEQLFMEDKNVRVLSRAADAEQYLVTMQTFREFPDLWIGSDFDRLTRVSDANPQQSEYAWGSAQLVSFTSAKGEPLKAVLYKPDDFDPSRQYPMIVHFYARMSGELHNYRAPAPSAASINITTYVSNGYIVLTPDIVYTDGHPGQSAVDAVVPATLAMIDSGYVDPDAIGIEGFSWGGYQTAYIVTQTNLFKAASAGAPVANMSSAYGGIRWGAGINRSMQYERTQSRIGFTPWERPDLYLENSPLFHLPNVETPLIVMHNDHDGAVPWYQGIELYIGLRRLGKEIYLFNYNNEDHAASKTANVFDWDMRLRQFFDHQLRGAPKPAWMEDGIPFIQKGHDQVPILTDDEAIPVPPRAHP